MNGTILNIQHFSVNDGPGIRTTVFMKGCPLSCQWCCNPESQSATAQVRYFSSRCKGCLECIAGCREQSLTFEEGKIRRSFGICNECSTRTCIETCNYSAFVLSGKKISPEELTKVIALDIPFYRNSGGGVTFSGGEPLMQPLFLLELLKKCKSLGIHTAIETCGFAERKYFEEIAEYTDLILFDLKIIDPQLHFHYTGKDNALILDNLSWLSSTGKNIEIRFPLIPGITDTPSNLNDIADVLHLNRIQKICLEPYHNLGSEKYEEHGIVYSLDHLELYNNETVERISGFFREKGFICETA